MILGDFSTGTVINRRLVEALRVEVGLIDKRAGNRGAQHDKEGYENRQFFFFLTR